MLKKTITYTGYDGQQHEEDFYFNLSKAELALMEMSENDGLKNHIEAIVKAKNNKEIIAIFTDLVGKSVGRKSENGKQFIKNDQIRDEFMQSEAWTELLMELMQADGAALFVNGITSSIKKPVSN